MFVKGVLQSQFNEKNNKKEKYFLNNNYILISLFQKIKGEIMHQFNDLLEKVDEMPLESQEMFVDIIQKRLSEKKREKFIREVHESKAEYNAGNYQTGTSDDLFKALDI